MLEDVTGHRAFDDLVGGRHAADGLTEGCHLAHHVLEGRRRAAQALDAPLQQFALTDGFLDVFLDARLQHRVVLDAGRLPLEHGLRLLLHCVCVAQPVQQVLFELCHGCPPLVSGEALPYRGWDADQAIPE